MNCAVLIDWQDAPDFPEGDALALGRILAAYPLIAAKTSAGVHRRFVVTAAQPIKSAALQYGAVVLDPPSAESSGFAILTHAAQAVAREAAKEGQRLDLLIALSAQAPAVTGHDIDAGIDALQGNSGFDSAVSVSKLPGRLLPATLKELPDEAMEVFAASGPNMSAQDLGAWRPNGSLMILKPALLAAAGPLGWLGKKIFPIKQPGVWPIEYRWQVPALEEWLKNRGLASAAYAPELQPQAQKSAKPAPSRPVL